MQPVFLQILRYNLASTLLLQLFFFVFVCFRRASALVVSAFSGFNLLKMNSRLQPVLEVEDDAERRRM